MSLHTYNTRYGYGFIIPHEDYCYFDEDKINQLQNSDFTFIIDSWYPDISTYFFGIILGYADPGEYIMIPSVPLYDHNKFTKMMQEFKTFFPGREFYVPRHYILSCVD